MQRNLPPGAIVAALGLGAQGLDTDAIAREFAAAMPWRTTAVNDAALLVPAAGLDSGLGVIAGTGSIGVGRDAHGTAIITGGWGWVIGDEAGAAGVVREATRAALFAHDDGLPDDGLLSALLDAFDVENPERLARTVNDEPTMDHWGPRAPAVFAAAGAGSALASSVIDGAARSLVSYEDERPRVIRNRHTQNLRASVAELESRADHRTARPDAAQDGTQAIERSGGRSWPPQSAFAVQAAAGAVQKRSDAGNPSGSSPTAHRYALPELM